MTDNCTISRSTRVLDETTGKYFETPSIIYTGTCRIRFERSFVQSIDMESQILAQRQGVLFLPVEGSEQVAANDSVAVTASLTDQALLTGSFRVTGPFAQTYSTARRFPIEAVS